MLGPIIRADGDVHRIIMKMKIHKNETENEQTHTQVNNINN